MDTDAVLMNTTSRVLLGGVSTFLVLLLPVGLYVIRRWSAGGKCRSDARLDGKTVIITGANSGIGKQTTLDLASRGARIVMACRCMTKGAEAMKEVKRHTGNEQIFLEKLDLGSLKSVRAFARKFAEEYGQLHVLVNNAGIMMSPYTKTEDGFEAQFGVNHLGHFALTNLLLPTMQKSGTGRIVTVASTGHYTGTINFDDINCEKSFAVMTAYTQSKLANVLFTKELGRKLEGTKISAFSVHPGVVVTEISRHLRVLHFFIWLSSVFFFFKNSREGSQTSIHCVLEEGLEKQSGCYFADCRAKVSSKESCDEGVAKKLWELSEDMTGTSFPFSPKFGPR